MAMLKSAGLEGATGKHPGERFGVDGRIVGDNAIVAKPGIATP